MATKTARSVPAAVKRARDKEIKTAKGHEIGDTVYIPTGKNWIVPNPSQPREKIEWDRIREVLVPSMKRNGQRDTGKVMIIEGSKAPYFMIVGGEHRFHTCEICKIPFRAEIVGIVGSKKDLHCLSVADNTGGKGYTEQELANAVKKMKDEFGMDWKDIQDFLSGMAMPQIHAAYNMASLPDDVKEKFGKHVPREERINKGLATEIAAVKGKGNQRKVAKEIAGKPSRIARSIVQEAQHEHGRATGETIPRPRRASDVGDVFRAHVEKAAELVGDLTDYKSVRLKPIIESKKDPVSNRMTALRMMNVANNMADVLLLWLDNLPENQLEDAIETIGGEEAMKRLKAFQKRK